MGIFISVISDVIGNHAFINGVMTCWEDRRINGIKRKSEMRGSENTRTEYTAGQLAISKILFEIGVPHNLEENFPPYRVDIFVPKFWVAIEYDGPCHTFKKRDRERDERLFREYALPVLRLREFNPKEDIKLEVLEFFRKWEDSAISRTGYKSGGTYWQ